VACMDGTTLTLMVPPRGLVREVKLMVAHQVGIRSVTSHATQSARLFNVDR
jgi:hypothetical protein